MNKYDSYICLSGDNILTAVSVAKECGIVEAGETVVEVIAEEGDSKNPTRVYYSVGGTSKAPVSEFYL